MGALDYNFTAGAARAQLQQWTDPTSAKPYTPANGPNFYPFVNEVCERLSHKGLWKGVTQEVFFPGAPLGYITLPRRCLTIQGADVMGSPRDIYTQMNQFKLGSLGWRPANQYNQMGWTDLGDGWCSDQDIPYGITAYAQINITNPADAGKQVWLSGIYGNGPFQGELVHDSSGGANTGNLGFTLTTAWPGPVQSTILLSSIQAVHAGLSDGSTMLYPWSLSILDTNNNVTVLSQYEPGEQHPHYRRYKTGVFQPSQTLQVFCRKRIIDVAAETDPILPGSLAALRFGLMALIQEKAQEVQAAELMWANAQGELDLQIGAARGRIRITLPFRNVPRRALSSWVR